MSRPALGKMLRTREAEKSTAIGAQTAQSSDKEIQGMWTGCRKARRRKRNLGRLSRSISTCGSGARPSDGWMWSLKLEGLIRRMFIYLESLARNAPHQNLDLIVHGSPTVGKTAGRVGHAVTNDLLQKFHLSPDSPLLLKCAAWRATLVVFAVLTKESSPFLVETLYGS